MNLANLEAEQAVLGSLLVRNEGYHRLSPFLRAEHFANGLHAKVYEVTGRLIDKGQLANLITLKSYLAGSDAFTEAGGDSFLAALGAASVHVLDVESYGRIIYDLYARRRLEEIAGDLRRVVADTSKSAGEHIEATEQALYELATFGKDSARSFQPLATGLGVTLLQAEAAYKRQSQIAGLATGLEALDEFLGGLNPSDLVVIAGRPSMGKTALATNISVNIARRWTADEGNDGAVVGFFTLEMAADQLTLRIAAQESEIPSERIRRGKINQDEFDRLIEATVVLERLPFYIDESPALSIASLRSRARRLQRQHGLGLLVVDYLQLITSDRKDGRVQEVSEISRGLKTIAKELGVPVIALSQLSRDVEKRPDKRPLLSDLRESGSIEQDADIVLFIYRESYYLDRDEPVRKEGEEDQKFSKRVLDWQTRTASAAGRADLIVAKHRHGPTGSVKVMFDGVFTKFSDIPEEP